MPTFLSYFNNKKALLFVFLFLIVAVAIIPQIAFAQWYNPAAWIGETATNVLNMTVNAIIAAFLLIPLFLSAFAADFAGIVLTSTLTLITTGTSYTHSAGVNIGWPIMRDLANMIIVLGFIVIGISTALRFKEYEAKQLLVKLIVVALLVNFSLLICGIFIDGTNIMMNFFFIQIKNANWYAPNLSMSTILIGNIPNTSWIYFGAEMVSLMFFNFIAFFIYLLYILLLLGRVVALWMLVILSPLAFVCYVFPATKGIWQMWSKNFSQWCIVGIPAGLFYYIGAQMIAKTINTPPINLGTDTIFGSTGLTQVLSGSFSLLLPGLFLIVGFFVSLQFAQGSASAILNFANKNKGKAMSGALGALNKAHSATTGRAFGAAGNKLQQMADARGNTDLIGKGQSWAAAGLNSLANPKASSQKTRSAFGRLGEAVGARSVGVTASGDAKIVKESADQIKFEYDRAKINNDRKTIDRIRNDAKTGQGTKGVASYKVISDGKDLTETFKDSQGRVKFDEIYSRGRFAEANGAQGVVKENEKLNPELRKYNEYELGEKAKIMPAGTSRASLEDAVVADGFKKAGVADIKNFHKSVLGSKAFIENVQAKAIERAANTELSSEQVTAIKSHSAYLQSEMKNCYLPGSNILDQAKSDRYHELERKLKQIAII